MSPNVPSSSSRPSGGGWPPQPSGSSTNNVCVPPTVTPVNHYGGWTQEATRKYLNSRYNNLASPPATAPSFPSVPPATVHDPSRLSCRVPAPSLGLALHPRRVAQSYMTPALEAPSNVSSSSKLAPPSRPDTYGGRRSESLTIIPASIASLQRRPSRASTAVRSAASGDTRFRPLLDDKTPDQSMYWMYTAAGAASSRMVTNAKTPKDFFPDHPVLSEAFKSLTPTFRNADEEGPLKIGKCLGCYEEGGAGPCVTIGKSSTMRNKAKPCKPCTRSGRDCRFPARISCSDDVPGNFDWEIIAYTVEHNGDA